MDMYLSDKHLQEFIAHGKSPEQLARLFTEKVVEVEALHRWELDRVVVGEVKAIKPHPQADRLRLIETSVGERQLTIVCGGKNLYEGQKVAVALVGSKVRWHGQGDKVKLEPATIRGIKSEGMICAAGELELPIADRSPNRHPEFISGPSTSSAEMLNQVQHDGNKDDGPFILDLTRFIPEAKAGTPLAKALGLDDARYEIDNKSLARRADLWGYWGMSREVSLMTGARGKKIEFASVQYSPSPPARRSSPETSEGGWGGGRIASIQDKKGCWRYIATHIDNIKVVESPWEVQRKLIQAGLRPINLIVDLTNLVMIELGQPMHAFDARYADKIVVRKAKKGEKLTALNGKEYALESVDCVIANSKEVMALAGIIGGEHSGVTEDTTSIILESATFEPVMIRKTSQRLLLRTDSSARFEKGQSVEMANLGVRRFVFLLKRYQPATTVVHAESLGSDKTTRPPVTVEWGYLDRLIGNGVISSNKARRTLKDLGCAVTTSKVRSQKSVVSSRESEIRWRVTPPFWRNDIEIAEDVAEEVSRLYGFNAIPHALPTLSVTPPYQDPLRTLVECIRTFLVERCAFTEVESYPFDVTGNGEEKLEVISPISQDSKYLRDDLIPNILQAVEKNLRFFQSVRLFEIGRVFSAGTPSLYTIANGAKQTLPSQPLMCAGALTAASAEEALRSLKGVVESLSAQMGWSWALQNRSTASGFDRERSLTIVCDQKPVGTVGLSSESFASNQFVALFTINLDALLQCSSAPVQYHSVSQFPPVLRDLAIVVDESISYGRIAALFVDHGKPLTHFELFDVYTKGLPAGKKSLAIHLTFSNPTRTLTSPEVNTAMAKLVKMCQNELGATIR